MLFYSRICIPRWIKDYVFDSLAFKVVENFGESILTTDVFNKLFWASHFEIGVIYCRFEISDSLEPLPVFLVDH